MVESDSPQMTVWCMHIVCWISKAIGTYSEYVIVIAFPRHQWLCERAAPNVYMYIACHGFLQSSTEHGGVVATFWMPGSNFISSICHCGRFSLPFLRPPHTHSMMIIQLHHDGFQIRSSFQHLTILRYVARAAS